MKPVTYRSNSGRYVQWEALIARARRLSGAWFLALPASPAGVIDSVRRRRAPALRALPPHTLQAELRNEYTDPSGTRYGDVYLRYQET